VQLQKYLQSGVPSSSGVQLQKYLQSGANKIRPIQLWVKFCIIKEKKRLRLTVVIHLNTITVKKIYPQQNPHKLIYIKINSDVNSNQ
jgi:hypothetical protein